MRHYFRRSLCASVLIVGTTPAMGSLTEIEFLLEEISTDGNLAPFLSVPPIRRGALGLRDMPDFYRKMSHHVAQQHKLVDKWLETKGLNLSLFERTNKWLSMKKLIDTRVEIADDVLHGRR